MAPYAYLSFIQLFCRAKQTVSLFVGHVDVEMSYLMSVTMEGSVEGVVVVVANAWPTAFAGAAY